MITLLIVADDFTGALDTGVQLAGCGAPHPRGDRPRSFPPPMRRGPRCS